MSVQSDVAAIEQCKGVLRHAWYPSTTDRVPEFGTYIANKCERCDSERLMIVGVGGRKLTNWRYVYKDKALYKSVTGSSMEDWRARYLTSMGVQVGGRRSNVTPMRKRA